MVGGTSSGTLATATPAAAGRGRRRSPVRRRPPPSGPARAGERSLLRLARLRLLHHRPHPKLLGQRADLAVGVATVTSKGAQEWELALLRPTGDGLGGHVK